MQSRPKRCSLQREVKRKLGKLLLRPCQGDNYSDDTCPPTPSSAVSWKDWDSCDVLNSIQWGQPIINLEKYVNSRILNDPKWLESEFKSLSQFDNQLSREKGMFCVARKYPERNRFSSVLANESSRVRFSHDDNLYINANHIHGSCFHVKQNYVACQAPLPECINDFWQMIFEQKSKVIVMLADEVNTRPSSHFSVKPDYDPFAIREMRRKVDQYWPNENEKLWFGSLTVESLSTTDYPNDYLSIRKIQLQKDGQFPQILHLYQFYGWPDMGVPKVLPFMNLLSKIDTQIAQDPEMGPIILHCVAGVGRTGTFAAIHVALTQIKDFMKVEDTAPSYFAFNIHSIVQELKRARVGMVQDKDQYKFVYTTILEGSKRLGYVFSDSLQEMDSERESSLSSSNSFSINSTESSDSCNMNLDNHLDSPSEIDSPTTSEVQSTGVMDFHFSDTEPEAGFFQSHTYGKFISNSYGMNCFNDIFQDSLL